jgi:ubiquinol-cytochrome c reductase cytochrome b subunit
VSVLSRVSDWLDERTGYRAALAASGASGVPGGARWWRGLGAAVTALVALEALTGLGLAAFYAPTTTSAWASVHYLQHSVALGWMLRGLHHYGAHGLIIALAAHFLQTLWSASYRSPRELNWLAGLALMNLLLAVAHTGFLLPGDQRAYFATQIMLGITGSIPLVGEKAQTLIQGGPEYGNLTLTHLYAAHVLLLPALLLGLLAFHVALVRKGGRSGSGAPEPYAARQRTLDWTVGTFGVALVLAVVLWRHGAPFDAPADPSQQYPGRPEWYFYPLFELRKKMEGSLEWVATVVIPGALMTGLALLPWLERRLTLQGRDGRKLLGGWVTAGLVGVVAFGVLPAVRDLRDETFSKMRAQADADAEEATRLATLGVPVEGPAFLYRNDPQLWGARVFAQKCASCHPPSTQDPFKGDPCLDGYASRPWLDAFLKNPRHPLFFGNTKIDEMDAFDGSTDRRLAVVEFLYAQADRPDVDKALFEKGKTFFGKEGCDNCHELSGKGSGLAPDLKGYASADWLSAFIRAPGASRFYADHNEMDAFEANKLTEPELKALVAWLHARSLNTPPMLSSIQ